MAYIEDRRYVRFFPLAVFLGLLLFLAGSAGPSAHQAGAQSANGLEAEYFDNANLTNPKLSRTDPNVNFSWAKGSPAAGVAADTFSVRWTGQLEAPSTGAYTFYTSTTDGARLWVDGKLVVDKWIPQKRAKEWPGNVSLTAGRHDVKMEYYENTGAASARLSWSGLGLSKQVIPQNRLFLPASPPPPALQCSDGADNDGDGKVDHPNDPGCESMQDDSESPDPPPPPPPPPSGTQRWSDPATWGGTVPRADEKVTIPAGKTVLLDRSTPPLGGLEIFGALVFEDDYHTLTTDWAMLHGKLEVGTEAEPIRTRARITLTGVNPDVNHMNMGAKVLGVMGGTLDIHGEDRAGWTKLDATARKGMKTLTLENGATGWRAGDRIAIASTDYDPDQDEQATVTAVSGNTVTLSRALVNDHYGEKQTFGGRTVDERAEVALLSRNVKIDGEETSSSDGFGGQIMAMDMTDGAMTHEATVRIEGAELTRMGQQGILRRYPVHFHMLGDSGQGSYLKNTSLHHTFNRRVTVHGTNNLDISGNTCYDHVGHGFFFEDGAEHDNVLEGNLGMRTREPEDADRLLESDRDAATFWITNPDNIVRNNHAAGSESIGFWLAFPEHPTGLSTDANIWPRRTPLGAFSGNVVHSNEDTGLNVDDGPIPGGDTETTWYNPRANPTPPPDDVDDSAPVVAEFRDFTGYKNRNRAVWLRGENHRVVYTTLADNAIGATFASEESMLTGSLVVGETANKGNPHEWDVEQGRVGEDGRALPRPWWPEFPIRGYEFYDGRVGAENTTFANFTPNAQREASGLGVLLEDDFALHPRNFASSLSFVNAQKLYMPDPVRDGDRSAVFTDQSGSVTGTAGAVVTSNNECLTKTGCTLNGDWNAYVCPPGTEHVSLISEALEGGPAKVKPLTVTRESDNKTQILQGCCDDSTDAVTNLFPNQNYGVAFNEGTPARMQFVL